MNKPSAIGLVLAAVIGAGGCGSSSSTPSSTRASRTTTGASTTATTHASASTTAGSAGSPGALSAEAQSVATGDIPDNQVFLVLRNARGGFSMKYPEGWTIQGARSDALTISDKNNLVRVVIAHGPAPSTASVAAALSALKKSSPTLTFTAPQTFSLAASAHAVKAVYTTHSAPNPVTGKRVVLSVDRYVLAGPGGRVATVDLGTPRGVDNVDAYRMMIHSFTWR
jgi:guanyl-specific ribonuclease Sa